jgi:PAS domain-containing protein
MPQHLFEDNNFLVDLFNAIPFPTLVVDDDVRILFWNSSAVKLIGNDQIYRIKGGEILHCIHARETPLGCGHAPFCKECVIRNSVIQSIQGNRVYRKNFLMDLLTSDSTTVVPMLVTTSPFVYNGQALSLLILETISELMQLGRLIPICAKCKKVRVDDNKWEQVERYIKTHIVEVDFTHGLCPDCIKEAYPDYIPKNTK